jgi:hypothetical protein
MDLYDLAKSRILSGKRVSFFCIVVLIDKYAMEWAIGICSVRNVVQAKMETLWAERQFESSNPS